MTSLKEIRTKKDLEIFANMIYSKYKRISDVTEKLFLIHRETWFPYTAAGIFSEYRDSWGMPNAVALYNPIERRFSREEIKSQTYFFDEPEVLFKRLLEEGERVKSYSPNQKEVDRWYSLDPFPLLGARLYEVIKD